MKSKVIAFIILFLMQIACYSLISASSSKATRKNFRKHKLNKVDCSIYKYDPDACGNEKECFWNHLSKACENLADDLNKHNSLNRVVEDAQKLVDKLNLYYETHSHSQKFKKNNK